jgi:hypothetical protein
VESILQTGLRKVLVPSGQKLALASGDVFDSTSRTKVEDEYDDEDEYDL